MPTITSDHRRFELAIDRILSQYEDDLADYDNAYQEYQSSFSSTQIGEPEQGQMDGLVLATEAVNSSKYTLVIIVSAYVEAIANFYLSQKLTTDQFNAIENCKIQDKWTGLLEIVVEGYRIEPGAEMYGLLKTLVSTRNDLVHYKPKFRNEGKDVHKGSGLKHLKDDQKDRDKIRKWSKLPRKLIDNLLEYDKSYQAKVTALFSKAVSKGKKNV